MSPVPGQPTGFRNQHFRPVEVDVAPVSIERLVDGARQHALTAYDASYLLLALDRGLPLATLDKRLRTAAQDAGVALVI